MSNPSAEKSPMRWDLSNIYSGLEAEDYRTAVDLLKRQIADDEAFYEARGIRRLNTAPANDRALVELVEEVLERANQTTRLAETLQAFVYGYFSTDSTNAIAVREKSRLEQLAAQRQKLAVRRQAWIGSLEPLLDALIPQSARLQRHAHYLRRTARESRYLMDEPLEGLAADLCLDGAVALGNLQTKVTSQLEVPFEHEGRVQKLPVSQVQNFRFSADPQLRRRSYEAEIEAWQSIATTVAACLNGVKGTAQTLESRRGRESVLDVALDQNRIDRQVLEALWEAIDDAVPVFRRYLTNKARKLGHTDGRLPWWDLFAPLGSSGPTFDWPAAREFIVKKFATFSSELSALAARAFDERWIDAEPRRGKAGGAFCMEVPAVEQSRILANFDGSLEQLITLAHELGHAFHNHCQNGLEPLLRGSPMALAETASIFCETLVTEAALSESDPNTQLAILESQLIGATQVCLDIRSRFLFESALFERRREGELSPDELCQLMHQAQRRTYGDAVREETYHPFMWLWKPHYYDYRANFYNFPYAFGHLFGLGLFGLYQQTPTGFVERYAQLLRDTGRADSRDLAQRFGVDIAQKQFWQESLSVVASQVQRYEQLQAA